MEERDAERIKRMAVEAAERAAMNAAKKKKAEERIAGAPCSPCAQDLSILVARLHLPADNDSCVGHKLAHPCADTFLVCWCV